MAITGSTLSQNSFAQAPIVGMVDLRFPFNSVSVLIDSSQATALFAGAAVKMVDSVDGIPKVVACAANADECLGFINFDVRSVNFAAGQACEISMAGNVMYLSATGAIARGTQVQLDVSVNGGVAALVGSSGADVVGYAYDKAVNVGDLIRVHLKTPSFSKA